MRAYPDEFVEVEDWSLAQFNEKARELLQGPEGNEARFVQFALSGRYAHDGEARRVRLVPRLGACEWQESPTTVTRDFDSMIGVSTDLPFHKALAVYPVPNFRDTLVADNHLTHFIRLPTWDRRRAVSLHRIPNVCLGKLDIRQKTMLFFPRLYTGTRSALTQQHLASIYDDCVRTALQACVPEHMSHWPPDYSMAVLQSRDNRKQMHFSSIEVPSSRLAQFAAALRNGLEQYAEFKDSFFCHEWRGLKGATMHDPSVPSVCDRALNYATDVLDFDRIVVDDWHIDVGLELYSPGKILQWVEDGHSALVRHALPLAAPATIRKVLRTQKWHTDVSAHLYDLAGFRVALNTFGRADGVRYINAYTTDKSPMYQLHVGAFRRHRAQDLLPENMRALLEDVDAMGAVIDTCRGNNVTAKQEGCARIEVRVRLTSCVEALRTFPEELLEDCVMSFKPEDWWTFKYWRTAALRYVLHSLNNTSVDARVERPVLQLGAVAVWMLNAVMYRPGEKEWEAVVEMCCLTHRPAAYDEQEDDADEDVFPLREPLGTYFLADVCPVWDTYRLPMARVMSGDELARVYNVLHFRLLQGIFYTRGVKRKARGADLQRDRPARLKRPRTTVMVAAREGTPPPALNLDLAAQGVQMLAPPPELRGVDIPVQARDTLVHGHDESSVDDRVSEIWNQFIVDILQVSPNRKQAASSAYCTLTAQQRERATMDMFRQPKLPFDEVQLKTVDTHTWNLVFFNRFFPEEEDSVSDQRVIQHYGACSYYKLWQVLLRQVSKAHVRQIRESLERLWEDLLWMPYSGADRIWVTRVFRGGLFVRLPRNSKGSAPQIAVNERKNVPLSSFSLTPRGA